MRLGQSDVPFYFHRRRWNVLFTVSPRSVHGQCFLNSTCRKLWIPVLRRNPGALWSLALRRKMFTNTQRLQMICSVLVCAVSLKQVNVAALWKHLCVRLQVFSFYCNRYFYCINHTHAESYCTPLFWKKYLFYHCLFQCKKIWLNYLFVYTIFTRRKSESRSVQRFQDVHGQLLGFHSMRQSHRHWSAFIEIK